MARLQGLTTDEARRFRTGRPCLDLAHTGGDGPLTKFELLHTPADVSRWLGVITELDDIEAFASDVVDGRGLRRAVWNAAHHAIDGRPPAEHDRAAINQAAARTPPVPLLTANGADVRRPLPASQVLSLLARDAIDLLAGPLAGRIRECAAADCGLLYVDQSRTGNRTWCSMRRCGTRAKVRAHRERQSDDG
ncbi:MAG TPA: ABATE domain-containing protein [Pseudonocardiaceae bacterium]|jgi:predicted RNA-binding Zn ribbon-like protein|nr:ABATE domain-containing protein [Pseudonocardiaceae bacterium]